MHIHVDCFPCDPSGRAELLPQGRGNLPYKISLAELLLRHGAELLICLATVEFIVSKEWLEQSATAKQFLDERV